MTYSTGDTPWYMDGTYFHAKTTQIEKLDIHISMGLWLVWRRIIMRFHGDSRKVYIVLHAGVCTGALGLTPRVIEGFEYKFDVLI